MSNEQERSDDEIRADLAKRDERDGPFPADGVQAALRRLANDVPSLLAEVRSLRGVAQAVEARAERARDEATEYARRLVNAMDGDEALVGALARGFHDGWRAALAAAADAPQPENEQCSATHERYGRCDLAAGHGERHTSDVGADGPDDPGYQWGVRGTDADPWPGPSPAVLPQTEKEKQRPHDLGWFSLPLETRQAIEAARAAVLTEEQQRRKADYDSGRWCGECRWGHVEDPPCCFTVPPVSGVAGNPEEAGEK